MRGRLAASVALVLVLAAPIARAQRGDPALAAEDLFQRGKAMMAARDFAHACPLFLESYRLDPAGGTLQNLAVCYEEEGLWASAYTRFHELRTVSNAVDPPRLDRIRLAEEHIGRVEPKVSHLRVRSRDTAATVSVDGVPYLRASWADGIAIDPGVHDIVVSAPGKQPFRTNVTIAATATTPDLEVPLLAEAPKPEAQRDVAAERERARAARALRTGLVIGGVGVTILAAGAVFGALTIAENNTADEQCRGTGADFAPDGRCYRDHKPFMDATDHKDQAVVYANVANVLVPLGIVVAGVGAYFAFVRGTAKVAAAPTVRFGRAGFEGSF
jgi:hypothetical protein